MGSVNKNGNDAFSKFTSSALQILAQSATELLLATSQPAPLSGPGASPSQEAEEEQTIINSTTNYVTTNFADQFGYLYNAASSAPPNISGPVLAAGTDTVVYEPSSSPTTDIENYLQNVFTGSLPQTDVITLAQNLNNLVVADFNKDLSAWVTFTKRFNLPATTNPAGPPVTVDLNMVYSCQQGTDNKCVGIATYCFVAYSVSD
jgi:hypothetical protein